MTRTTESNNTIRIDKANHLEYELTFNIVSKTEGLESISVSGVKNGEYVFSVVKNYLPSANTNVNFASGNFDFTIVTDVMSEINDIADELAQ